MKFKNILLVHNGKPTDEHNKVLNKVERLLEDNNLKYNIVRDFDLQKSILNKKYIVITVGGDVTFISASHYIKKTPIIGINSEPKTSEGAWTSLKSDEIDELEEILKGNYKTRNVKRIDVYRNDVLLDSHALNEVYVGAANQFHTSRYELIFKNKKEYQKSSGVLISTSFGSNSWFKSAGGNPFQEQDQLRFVVREPFEGKIFCPKLTSGKISQGESLIMKSKRKDGGIIAIDSTLIYEFNNTDNVEINLSNNELNILEPVEKYQEKNI